MHGVGNTVVKDNKNLGLCLQKELLRKGPHQRYAISATPLSIPNTNNQTWGKTAKISKTVLYQELQREDPYEIPNIVSIWVFSHRVLNTNSIYCSIINWQNEDITGDPYVT